MHAIFTLHFVWYPYRDFEMNNLKTSLIPTKERCVNAGLMSTLPHALKRRQIDDVPQKKDRRDQPDGGLAVITTKEVF